ncbi:uncharacterized protein PV09_07425 [Verruconis gallopava]|uniref:TeaA receptor TeaR n=1 Tax=Verruconis gallopava TaxID=253628 RepID=A0A0D2APQ0_9PEZI|nr:uncharacterized protein PV09_07425 [Verruconis gallopava]KIW01139.1 hypothetical protein PV09_07425 [Verruconis gallopava]
MATMSATQQIRTITPPSSSHGNSAWDYENQQSAYTDDKPPRAGQSDSRPPLSQNVNGSRKMSYGSDTNARVTPGPENDSASMRKMSRKKSSIRQDSESDASFDMYKTTSGSRSISNGIDRSGKRKPSNAKIRNPEDDEDNWIHRDKLAQIESRELEEAGFPVVRTSRSGSRAGAGTAYVRQDDYEQDGDVDEYKTPKNHDTKRQRVVSPIPAEEEEDEGFDFELRTPEEVAAEQESRYFQSPPLKPNGTRIPMPKQSPVPVPSIIMERDSPLPRSRASSGTGIPEIRSRSRSISSQVMLEDDVPRTPLEARRPSASDDSPSSSPPKTKAPAKGSSTSGTRKASNQRNASGTSKYRASSQQNRNSPEKRPGTSSGRPSTSHRPEGDPPWLATMYKPDPRLPPDQQMLPTHARRLAQEKWEKEGKTGTVYDREFRLLNTEEIERPLSLDFSNKDTKPTEKSRPANIQTENKWPLASPLGSPNQASRPGTSGTEHGGYSTMPKITTPPIAAPTPAKVEKPQEHVKLPEPNEEVNEKKGCCCIVM